MPFTVSVLSRLLLSTLVTLTSLGLPIAAGSAQQRTDQANLRNTFPGRRVGGGTRAECASRLLVHLVSPSSTFSPGSSGRLALLEGPARNPRSVAVIFRDYRVNGLQPTVGPVIEQQTLPAGEAGIHLFKAPTLSEPVLWESSFNCQESGDSGAGLLDFVQAEAPPALTLLLSDPSGADQSVAEAIAWLSKSCGSTVAVGEVAARFQLKDIITSEWPGRLPVRC